EARRVGAKPAARPRLIIVRATILIALAACSAAAPSAPVAGQVEPPPPRATPSPTIGWAQNAFDTHTFPLIARAGEVAVMAIHDGDGGRGYPNLHLEVHDRSDRVIQTIAVMDANNYEKLVVDDKPTPELQRRIATANRELEKLHGLHDLIAMQALEIQ